jgi:hypothetical protein
VGRIFTAKGGQSTAASATKTQIRVTAHTNRSIRLRRVRVAQSTHKTGEQYDVALQECSAAGTDTAHTPHPYDGISTFQGTCGINSSVEPTYTSGKQHINTSWNSVLAYERLWADGKGPEIAGAGIIGLKITTPSGTTTFTPNCELEFEEIP